MVWQGYLGEDNNNGSNLYTVFQPLVRMAGMPKQQESASSVHKDQYGNKVKCLIPTLKENDI